jgi:hypothetical protein
MPKRDRLVRFCSPFGSPAWMPKADADRLLDSDDERWVEWSRLGVLSNTQREHGPPRIEFAPDDPRGRQRR